MANPPSTPSMTTPRQAGRASANRATRASVAVSNENEPPTVSTRTSRTKNHGAQPPPAPLQDKVNEDAAMLQAFVSRVAALELQLAKERAEKEQLSNSLAEAQDVAMMAPDRGQDPENQELWDQLEAVEQELEEERKRSADLEEQVKEQLALSEARNAPGNDSIEDASILRPKGTAGQEFGIQISMGLGGSTRKTEFYKGIQRQLRDLSISAQLNWEVEWANIPTVDKAKFFCVAREKIPFLKRFRNDWATEEIVKQYFKNKRKNHYKNGWLDIPERYKHLKDTAAKRDPSGSRVKRVTAARLAAKRSSRRPPVASNNSRNREQNAGESEGGEGNEYDNDVDMEGAT